MPEGFQSRLIAVLVVVLGAIYILLPTLLDITCEQWQFGCLDAGEEVAAATPAVTPGSGVAGGELSDPETPPDIDADVAGDDGDAAAEDGDADATAAAEDTPEADDGVRESGEADDGADGDETGDAGDGEETGDDTETADADGDGEEPEATPEEEDEDKEPFLKSILPKNRLRLGLDLVGGIHVVIDVKTEDALRLTAENFRRDIEGRLTDEKIPFESVKRPGDKDKLEITLTDPLDRTKVSALITEKVTLDLIESSFETNEAGQGVSVWSFSDDRKDTIEEDAVARVLEILRSRVDEFGVAEPLIYRERGTRIVVQLPGLTDPETAIRTIKRTARLEFRIIAEDFYSGEGVGEAKLARITANAFEALGEDAEDLAINEWAWAEKEIPDDTQIVWEKEYDRINKTNVRTIPWLVRAEIGMTGDKLESARVSSDNFGKPVVAFTMTPEGSVIFGDLTQKNIEKRLAVILEGKLESAPVIRDKITRNGQITLGNSNNPAGDFQEAKEIAQVLRSGALPATVSIEQNWTVGSTLGEDSIRQGRNALLIGAIFVLIFMGFWYKFAGVIADTTVLLSGVVLFALMTMFGFVLTLPGIAGIVLTVGMAVDANVLIYERIREELRLGKIPRAAMDAGFEKAFSTIMDANLTTAAAGFVLYYFGTGPIQGFALTLLCGIATTLFGGLVITRLFFEYWVYGRKPDKISI